MTTFDFTKRKPVKCAHCGKPQWDHLARTYHCPVGKPHRTVGFTAYHRTQTFAAPSGAQP